MLFGVQRSSTGSRWGRMCPLNGGGRERGALPPPAAPPAAPPLQPRPRRTTLRITQVDPRCSVRVSHGENNDGQDEAVHGPEARDERAEEEGDGVPAEPALRRELHPERHLRRGACPAPGGLAGGGGRWEVFHEGRHSADRPDRCCQWGQYGSDMSPPPPRRTPPRCVALAR